MHAGCALSHHASRHRLHGRGGHHRCSGGQGSAASVLPVLRVVARGGYQLHHRTPLPSPPTSAGAASKLKPAVLTGTRSATSRLCASAPLDTIRGLTVLIRMARQVEVYDSFSLWAARRNPPTAPSAVDKRELAGGE